MAINQAMNRVYELPREYQEIIAGLIEKFLSIQNTQEKAHHVIKYGLGAGTAIIPDDIDFCNDEIAKLFGV